MRTTFLALVVLGFGAAAAPAQGWAEKMFKGPDGKPITTHDFGSVPRGAQLFHRFTVTNIYAVRMEIVEIAAGCTCVEATAAQRVLEPRQTTTLDVKMDTRRFTGPKTVTLRVKVGPEFVSTAEVKVSANSRVDVVFNPGQVAFGTVAAGQTPSQPIDVEYAGALKWEVEKVVTNDLPLEAELKELYRRPNQVGYQVRVKLKADAPIGALKEFIYLKTNDPAGPLVPVLVEAVVQAPLTVTPGTLALNNVKAGEPVKQFVMVMGNKPFRILKVEGLGDGVELGVQLSSATATVQRVTLKVQPKLPGEFKREIKILTDLQDAPVTVVVEGNAQ